MYKAFLIPWNVVIKETDFFPVLIVFSLSVREISHVFPEKMALKRVYTCLAISRH